MDKYPWIVHCFEAGENLVNDGYGVCARSVSLMKRAKCERQVVEHAYSPGICIDVIDGVLQA